MITLDEVFVNYNEVTTVEGGVYIVNGDCMLHSIGFVRNKGSYKEDLTHKDVDYADIMKVVNPFTKKVLYDRSAVDWSKVEVDTPILVKDAHYTWWGRRHFSHLGENGKIYAWANGGTSFTEKETTSWEYAKPYVEGEDDNE